MGGMGSGSWNARPSTRSALRLDIRAIHREGYLEPGTRATYTWGKGDRSSSIAFVVTGDDHADALHLLYTSKGVEVEQRIPLEWTPCNFGGERPWALCPRCSRRIAVLWSRGRFYCRKCHGLAYQSTREDRADRAARKARALRRRLGASNDLTEPIPWKPNGMHWRTYWQLREEIQEAEAEVLQGLIGGLERIAGHLGVDLP